MIKAIMTAAALSLALSGAAFAAEDAKGGPTGGLGIDIKAAGTTEESMTAFWKTMKPEDQKTVTEKCKDEQAMKGFSAEESKFCELTKKK